MCIRDRRLPAGSQITDLILGPCSALRVSSYDLSQFYDTIVASPQRSRRNRVGPSCKLEDLQQYAAAPADFPRSGAPASSVWLPSFQKTDGCSGWITLQKHDVGPAQPVPASCVVAGVRPRGRLLQGDALHRGEEVPAHAQHLFPDLPPGKPLCATGAYGALAQGDSWAVDIAQDGHFGIIRPALGKICLLYTSPSPRDS